MRIIAGKPAAVVAGLWLVSSAPGLAETATTSAVADQPGRPSEQDWSVHAQATSTTQEHPAIHSPYSGPNSLTPDSEYKTSYTATLFLGYRLLPWLEAYVNPEGQMGMGFTKTEGLAAFPNGEIYRVDNPDPKASWARYYLKATFGLGGATERIEDDQNQIAGSVQVTRLTVIGGKFALNDFFDNNKYAHDPRTQFLNWAMMDAGAWDYAADTRGYSTGGYLELNLPRWALRYAAVEEPTQANQMTMDEAHFPARVRGDNLELELRYSLGAHPGTTRILGYMNHAHMGNYQAAIDDPAAQDDVTLTRAYSIKRGAVLNMEQEIGNDFGAFLRLGWNDGKTETWAFTEIDRSFATGVSGKGTSWGRPDDSAGFGIMVDGLSPEHRDYLEAGGAGFLIGDGRLNYGFEDAAEAYYSVGLLRYIHVTPDFQYFLNPAYNKDRGPVPVYSLRVHAQI